jgi:DNA-binding LacI/PurR family transcriptional regulator
MPSFTLEDIARQTGVSSSTVPLVAYNLPNLREGVRRRVLKAIEKNGYRPHAAERTLASRRSSVIGLIPFHSIDLFFTDPYYPYLTKGISRVYSQHDQTLALFLAESREEEKTIILRMAHTGLLDGVIVQAGRHGDRWIIGKMAEAGIPMVVVGTPFRPQNIGFIDIDNVSASQRAVNHLLHLGYKRIGTIADPSASAVGVDWLAGYRKALMATSMGSNRLVKSSWTPN